MVPLGSDPRQVIHQMIADPARSNASASVSSTDLLLASAALDRLLHHAHVIEMEGDTFRNPPFGKRTQSTESKST